MLEHQAPAGYVYVGCKRLGRPNHATRGFLANYRVDHDEVTVAFLVAELRVLGQDGTEAETPA